MSRKSTEICSVESCFRGFYARGLCHSHYERQRKGRESDLAIGDTKCAAFFAALFTKPATEECIFWPFAVNSKGYGVYRDSSAHRFVCKTIHGDEPDGRPYVAHSCNVRRCVNPNHLRWASNSENESDKLKANTFYQRGQFIPDQIVRAIRSAAPFKTTIELSREFGVSRSHTWRIARCKSRPDCSLS